MLGSERRLDRLRLNGFACQEYTPDGDQMCQIGIFRIEPGSRSVNNLNTNQTGADS